MALVLCWKDDFSIFFGQSESQSSGYGLLDNNEEPWVEGEVDDEEEEEEFIGGDAGGNEKEGLDFGEQHHHHQYKPEHVVPSPPHGRYYYGPPYPDNVAVMNRMESLEQTMGQFRDLILDTRREIRGTFWTIGCNNTSKCTLTSIASFRLDTCADRRSTSLRSHPPRSSSD
ncbi:hypothetical protein L1987_37817 [Smallanthus sonchifolius]|uniref:Uncharacterized protein n=1 Tax=Smallanthus sonchifolius TaxID=185202 RepID=A0ACB9HIM0_9ASTR|nr:hypothetical protein L1987_37817 [Smallanthus sonchifolius]